MVISEHGDTGFKLNYTEIVGQQLITPETLLAMITHSTVQSSTSTLFTMLICS